MKYMNMEGIDNLIVALGYELSDGKIVVYELDKRELIQYSYCIRNKNAVKLRELLVDKDVYSEEENIYVTFAGIFVDLDDNGIFDLLEFSNGQPKSETDLRDWCILYYQNY